MDKKKVIIVLLIIAIVFSLFTVFINMKGDGDYTGSNDQNNDGNSEGNNINAVIIPNSFLGVLYGI